MIDGRPSYTAMSVASHRAIHQLLDEPKIFSDPLALAILGPPSGPRWEKRLRQAKSGVARGLRTFLAVRSRFAEDRLDLARARGVIQYVVLGAGLDTFAYRTRRDPAELRVFEVDHPATQNWKRDRLSKAGIALPPTLAFVPVDFEKQTLADALNRAGFRTDQPAFFSWLGVTVYLTRPSIESTWSYVASLASGTEIVFDYGVSPKVFSWRMRFLLFLLRRRVAWIGEPWKTFFLPSQLADDLRRLGYRTIEDFGAKDLNPRYCAHRADGLRLGPTARIAVAGI